MPWAGLCIPFESVTKGVSNQARAAFELMTGDGALRAICRARELTRSIEPCVVGRSLHAACVSDQEHVEPGEGSCGAMAASGEGVVGKLAHPAESVALIRGEGIPA